MCDFILLHIIRKTDRLITSQSTLFRLVMSTCWPPKPLRDALPSRQKTPVL